MNTHVDKTSKNEKQVVHGSPEQQSKPNQGIYLVNNRPEAVVQRKLQSMLNKASAQKKSSSTSTDVIQRVEINSVNVSLEVLAAFHSSSIFFQQLFHSEEALPSFFAMGKKKQLEYFRVLKRAMPMIRNMGYENGAETSPFLNEAVFFHLNPDFVQQSLSLFNGGGATFHFYSPKGDLTYHFADIQSLNPQHSLVRYTGGVSASAATMADHAPAKMPGDPIAAKQQQYVHPDGRDSERNAKHDVEEAAAVRPLLIASLRKSLGDIPLEEMSFAQLELLNAKIKYHGGKLSKLPSMKKISLPDPETGVTHLDALRAAEVLKAKHLEGGFMRLMPKLVALSHKIRLANYYDAASEEAILNSGRLQSKERRMLKSGGKAVPNKSDKLDDELGNTDHVFFFAEYEEDHSHPAPFRRTRFADEAAEDGSALMHQKAELDGSERRVSFPLNSIRSTGMHGYVQDLVSMGGLDPVKNTFSAMPMHDVQRDAERGLGESVPSAVAHSGVPEGKEEFKGGHRSPAPGAHLLMDLLRQRFAQSNFPGKKDEGKRIADLDSMSLKDLYTFLFRIHPTWKENKDKENMNPQILVPGSVPFSTKGVRFDKPSPSLGLD